MFRRATITGYSAETHSYTVHPDEREAEIEIPAASVRLPDGCVGVVIGLVGAAEHNGKECHLLGLHEDSGRYEVALSASQTLRLKRENLRS